MPQRVFINVNPPCSINNWRTLQEVQWSHRGRGVQKSEVDVNGRLVGFLKFRLAIGRIDGYQVVLKVSSHYALNAKLIESIRVFFDTEHGRHPAVKINLDVIPALRLLVP